MANLVFFKSLQFKKLVENVEKLDNFSNFQKFKTEKKTAHVNKRHDM